MKAMNKRNYCFSASNPIFIVGCSRSGTTLLQSILGRHPDIHVFPETNILFRVLNDLNYRRYGETIGRLQVLAAVLGHYLNKNGLTTKNPWKHLQDFLDTQEMSWSPSYSRRPIRSIDSVFFDFCCLMEAASKKTRWLEKSPQNIFCLHLIQHYIPDARIIHIVREGKENLASLAHAASKHRPFTERFGGEDGLIKAIHYYNACLDISAAHKDRQNEIVVRYEDVVNDPKAALSPVSRLLNIEISDDMLVYDSASIRRSAEVWKINDATIRRQPAKFKKQFSSDQQQLIIRQLTDPDVLLPRISQATTSNKQPRPNSI